MQLETESPRVVDVEKRFCVLCVDVWNDFFIGHYTCCRLNNNVKVWSSEFNSMTPVAIALGFYVAGFMSAVTQTW